MVSLRTLSNYRYYLRTGGGRTVSQVQRQFFSSGPKNNPVKHIVMFRFKPGTTESVISKVQKDLLQLPVQLSSLIQSYELGVDLLLEGGQSHPAGPNRQMCWTAVFGSVQDYQAYDASPEHVAFLDKLREHVEPGSRAAIQYEVASLFDNKD